MAGIILNFAIGCQENRNHVKDAAQADSAHLDTTGANAMTDTLENSPLLSPQETDSLSIAFIEEFYSHMPGMDGVWKREVLQRYLAPAVLDTLKAFVETEKGRNGNNNLAWLKCVGEFTVVKRDPTKAVPTGDGRYEKTFTSCYFGDGFLYDSQTLYYTVKGLPDHPLITRIDSMGDDLEERIMYQRELMEQGREIMKESDINDDQE